MFMKDEGKASVSIEELNERLTDVLIKKIAILKLKQILLERSIAIKLQILELDTDLEEVEAKEALLNQAISEFQAEGGGVIDG